MLFTVVLCGYGLDAQFSCVGLLLLCRFHRLTQMRALIWVFGRAMVLQWVDLISWVHPYSVLVPQLARCGLVYLVPCWVNLLLARVIDSLFASVPSATRLLPWTSVTGLLRVVLGLIRFM